MNNASKARGKKYLDVETLVCPLLNFMATRLPSCVQLVLTNTAVKRITIVDHYFSEQAISELSAQTTSELRSTIFGSSKESGETCQRLHQTFP